MKKIILYILIIIGFLAISFLVGRWSTKQERSIIRSNLVAARDSVNTYSVEISGLKQMVFEKDAIVLSEREAKKILILDNERLKKLHLKEVVINVELVGTIKILRDSLKAQPETVFITVRDTSGITNDYVRIPFTLLKIKEEFLTLNAGMKNNRKAWFDLTTPLSGIMTIGYQKDGFLKSKPIGIFTTRNPYLTINNMDILIVEKKTLWFQKWWVHVLTGAIVVETIHQFAK